MKFFKIKPTFFLIVIWSFSGCSAVGISKADNFSPATPPTPASSKKKLAEIDLTRIKHIAPKGRAQEDDNLTDENFNKLSVADDLLAHGTDSIPFLIEKLDDERQVEGRVINFWREVYVADIALIILMDFFTADDGVSPTVKGFSWDEFLERGADKNATGEEILRRYIEKHGRKAIKARWRKMWDENRENIFWDETERCFKIKKDDK